MAYHAVSVVWVIHHHLAHAQIIQDKTWLLKGEHISISMLGVVVLRNPHYARFIIGIDGKQ